MTTGFQPLALPSLLHVCLYGPLPECPEAPPNQSCSIVVSLLASAQNCDHFVFPIIASLFSSPEVCSCRSIFVSLFSLIPNILSFTVLQRGLLTTQLDLLSHGVDVGPGSLLPVPGSVRICTEAALGCMSSGGPVLSQMPLPVRLSPFTIGHCQQLTCECIFSKLKN